jgi:hypothetical protein
MRKFAGVLLVFLCCITAAMAADFAGTWRLNPEKSKLRSPETETMTIEKTGPNSYRTSIEQTNGSGHQKFVRDRVYDGKEHAVSGGSGKGSEICTMGAGGARKIVMLEDGKVNTTITSTISEDGQTLTNVRVDAHGQDVMVYDREK